MDNLYISFPCPSCHEAINVPAILNGKEATFDPAIAGFATAEHSLGDPASHAELLAPLGEEL